MKARHLIYSLSVLCMLVFSACEREELENTQNGGTGTKMELMSVPSKFIVTPFGLQPGDTTSVKAESYSDLEMQIMDFWLIQFDGSGKLLASVYHAPELVSNHVQMDNTNGNIAATKTVWIVANTGDASGLATETLRAQLAASKVQMVQKDNSLATASELQIFEKDGYKFTTDLESSIASLNRADGAILMSGKCAFDAADLYDPYPDGTPNYDVAKNGLEVTLSSMVAKLTINYKVEGSGYTFNTIKLFRIPDRASFAKNDISRTDYKLLSYEYLIPNTGSTEYDGSITIYIPQNKRLEEHYGTPDAKTKTFNAPPKASYISFGLTKSTGDKVSVNVFPGGSADGDENKFSDYNLCANAYYTETINITSSTLDSYLADELKNKENRVIEKLQQNITSNCYILNPLTDVKAAGFNYSNLREEYYSLPVVARVNEAWYGQDNGKTILSANDEWRMEVIWQDVPGRQVYFSESSGLKAWKNQYGAMENRGSDGANNPSYAHYYYGRGNGENGFVNIFVEKETQTDRTEGNVLIGLRKKTGVDSNGENTYGDIIWSWHLWVTDYNPDAAGAWSSGSGYYAKVPGDTDDSGVRDGKVFHYKFWNNNYQWIMDRLLGALGWRPPGLFMSPGWDTDSAEEPDPVWVTESGNIVAPESFGMYYQWGRKDPFPANDLMYDGENFMNTDEGTDSYITQFFSSNPVYFKNMLSQKQQDLWDISGTVKLVTSELLVGGGAVKNFDIWTVHSEPTVMGNMPVEINLLWRHPDKSWPSGTPDSEIVGVYDISQGSKSLFDPCPAGWELPKADAYEGIYAGKKTEGGTNYQYISAGYAKHFHEIENVVGYGTKNRQAQIDNGAWEIKVDATSGLASQKSSNLVIAGNNDREMMRTSPDDAPLNSDFFPPTGFIDNSGKKGMGGVGDIWAADTYNSGSTTYPSYLYIGRSVGNSWENTGTTLYIGSTNYSYNTTFGRNNAFSVRCVKKNK